MESDSVYTKDFTSIGLALIIEKMDLKSNIKPIQQASLFY